MKAAAKETRVRRKALLVASGCLWILSTQSLALQFAAQASWSTPYSLNFNTISDLGATQCRLARPGHYGYVCSPMHVAMDLAFAAFGLMWLLGALLLYRTKQPPFDRLTIVVPLALAGLGAIIVGAFPEDGLSIAHSAGAAAEFFSGIIAFTGVGLRLWRRGYITLGAASIILPCISTVSFCLFLLSFELEKPILGLSLGGWERLAYWPENLWLTVAGVLVLVVALCKSDV